MLLLLFLLLITGPLLIFTLASSHDPWPGTFCQHSCPPCVVVDPIVADQPDELSGVYQYVFSYQYFFTRMLRSVSKRWIPSWLGFDRFFREDPECPGGCSFMRFSWRKMAPKNIRIVTFFLCRGGLIYCMGPGPRTGVEECPATSSSSSPSSTAALSSSSPGWHKAL